MTKRIAILGSTGSIGKNTLRVIEGLGPGYEVVALSAHQSTALLARQCQKFNPKTVAITNESHEADLREKLKGFQGEIISGPQGLIHVATHPEADIVVTAVVGAAGLEAVLAAARQGKTLAIANKEPLVIAGELLMETARKHNAQILPVDSEHSAVFQAMQSGKAREVKRIILTASGGPFRNSEYEDMYNATVEDALNHPTWDMGKKITIDSATMMNKALEIIEAHRLFNVDLDRIEVLIHPESIIHSMVEFVDGSVIAQLGTPDMCVPIQYALTWPDRLEGIASHLDFTRLGKLTFEKPNPELFRSLTLAYETARADGSAPVVFNAANEAAVEAFLNRKIRFGEIIRLVEQCLDAHEQRDITSIDDILQIDRRAREWVKAHITQNTAGVTHAGI